MGKWHVLKVPNHFMERNTASFLSPTDNWVSSVPACKILLQIYDPPVFNLLLLFFLPCYLGSFVFTTFIYTFSPSLSICANLSSILKSLNFLTYSQCFLSSPRPSSERSSQVIENSHSCRVDSENFPLHYLPHSMDVSTVQMQHFYSCLLSYVQSSTTFFGLTRPSSGVLLLLKLFHCHFNLVTCWMFCYFRYKSSKIHKMVLPVDCQQRTLPAVCVISFIIVLC